MINHKTPAADLRIEKEKCIGCGFCRETVPSLVFSDGYVTCPREQAASLLKENEILQAHAAAAERECPAHAFHLVDSDSEPAKQHRHNPAELTEQSVRFRSLTAQNG